MTLREKVRGMFLGVAIGDALGMPVEGYSREKILANYNTAKDEGIFDYLSPVDHKWFSKLKPGQWTDDTQLTLAVAKGLIAAKDVTSVDSVVEGQVKAHIDAFHDTNVGWGRTTRTALEALSKGEPYLTVAPKGPTDGYGNGVAMKIAPFAALFTTHLHNKKELSAGDLEQMIVQLTLMTHYRAVTIGSAFAMFAALSCLLIMPDPQTRKFEEGMFISNIIRTASRCYRILPLTEMKDDIVERLCKLAKHRTYNEDRIIDEFKGGCYCYESIPFTLMYFVKNPYYISTMFNCIAGGGDTDSNGSMCGALLGAYHGESFFPEHLVENLDKKDEILKIANDLCDKLGIS